MIRSTLWAPSLALALALSVPASAQSYLTAPADPKVRVRDPGYADVTAGVKTFDVTGPKDWIEQNRQVAPRSGTGDTGQNATAAARRGR